MQMAFDVRGPATSGAVRSVGQRQQGVPWLPRHEPSRQEVIAMPKPIPDDYPRVSPYLIVDGAGAAIEFYCSVLGATERARMPGPDGRVGHAELEIGDAVIMLADEYPEMDACAPPRIGGTPVTLHVYVEDVDAVFERALAAGARALRPVEDRFYGDRSGQFEDPFGHRWNVATHVEDVPPEEMSKRAAAMAAD
jgi:PhnB protein